MAIFTPGGDLPIPLDCQQHAHTVDLMDANLRNRTLRLSAVADGDLRRILARLLSARLNLRDRGLSEFARASMAEGLANKPIGTYTRDRNWREKAKKEIPRERWKSEDDFETFFGQSPVGFPAALMAGIHKSRTNPKVKHWLTEHDPEDYFHSLSMGLTLGNMQQAAGGPLYRATGATHKSNNNLSLRGLMGNVKNNAAGKLLSLVRQRNPDVRGDAPVGEAEGAPSLFDLMEDTRRSREVTNILRDATPALKRRLSDSEFKLWNVILTEPDLMIADRDGNPAGGLKTTEAEKIHQRIYGESPAKSILSRKWKKMLPVVIDELNDALVTWGQATQRLAARRVAQQAMAARVASRYLKACGDKPCGTCEGCGCGGKCDGGCGEEAMMEKTSPAPELPPGKS